MAARAAEARRAARRRPALGGQPQPARLAPGRPHFLPAAASESCDEAVPSSSSSAATSSLRWADASEAPIAGSALELVRPVRECELPAHLRLPQVWLVRASMGSRGQAASSFLRGWSEDTKNKNKNAGGGSSTAATDALIVRADGPGGSAPLLLLLYCRGVQVRAQLITPPDSLAGALRFLELKALRGDGDEEEEAVMEEAEEAGTAPQLAWRKALPLERASQLLQQLQKPHDPYDEPPSWDGSVRRALRQVRCVAPQPPADDDDAESRLLREASAAADRADARHRVTSLSDLASSDALANNVPSDMPPPLPKQQGQGGGGSNSRPSATTKASGKRPASGGGLCSTAARVKRAAHCVRPPRRLRYRRRDGRLGRTWRAASWPRPDGCRRCSLRLLVGQQHGSPARDQQQQQCPFGLSIVVLIRLPDE